METPPHDLVQEIVNKTDMQPLAVFELLEAGWTFHEDSSGKSSWFSPGEREEKGLPCE
jgi:hypothetical protein